MSEMRKLRLCFSKQRSAAYISHLDTMRMFQRAFLRADISVKHTEGFNPHAYVAIALPLPVSHESVCEILDFASDDGNLESMPDRLNAVMPDGIKVYEVYEPERKFSDLYYVDNVITFEYDHSIPPNAVYDLETFFSSHEILVNKKTKKGDIKELNIKPLIVRINFFPEGKNRLTVCALLQAQSPYLNPIYITAAVEKYLPQLAPDFSSYRRMAIADKNFVEWR